MSSNKMIKFKVQTDTHIFTVLVTMIKQS